MAYCDLHTHSSCSDGTDSPTQLIQKAEALGLQAIALTDHNCIAGLPEFLQAAQNSRITAVGGAEFSVDLDGKELHLLALFLRPDTFSGITATMEKSVLRKEQSNLELAHSLNKAGYRVDYAAMKAASPTGMLNRAHFATELIKNGHVRSMKDAFDTILAPGGGFYHPPKRFTVWQSLAWMQELGAVPVLAHPFLRQSPQELQRFLPEAKKAGLVGMEVRYTEYDAETTRLATQMADSFGLLPSGGSDYHGNTKPDIALGSGWGNLQIPMEWMEKLSEYAK